MSVGYGSAILLGSLFKKWNTQSKVGGKLRFDDEDGKLPRKAQSNWLHSGSLDKRPEYGLGSRVMPQALAKMVLGGYFSLKYFRRKDVYIKLYIPRTLLLI